MTTYSFLDVQAGIVGPGAAFSLGADAGVSEEGISVAMTEDKNTMTIGAGGQGMHSLHAGKSGQLTVRLLKTSPTNLKLSAAYALQTADSSLHGQNTIVITNPKTGDIVTAQQCAFKKLTDLAYAKDGGFNVWVFDAIIIDTLLGSN